MTETRPLAAALSVLSAMALIGLVDNFVVRIAETHSLWQFHVTRTILAMPAFIMITWFGLGVLRPKSWTAVGLRSFFVSTSMVIYFGCLAFLPISQAAAGLFTSPIWILLVSSLFLGRPVGPVRIIAALVGFIGVILVLKPEEFSLLSFVPVLAGLFYAISGLLTREICASEGTLSLVAGSFVGLAAWGCLAIGIIALFPQPVPDGADGFLVRGWIAPDWDFMGWMVIQAAGSGLGVFLLIRGYQLGDAPFVATYEFSFLVFASIWAYILRGETVDVVSALGITMIIGAGVIIAFRGRQT